MAGNPVIAAIPAATQLPTAIFKAQGKAPGCYTGGLSLLGLINLEKALEETENVHDENRLEVCSRKGA